MTEAQQTAAQMEADKATGEVRALMTDWLDRGHDGASMIVALTEFLQAVQAEYRRKVQS